MRCLLHADVCLCRASGVTVNSCKAVLRLAKAGSCNIVSSVSLTRAVPHPCLCQVPCPPLPPAPSGLRLCHKGLWRLPLRLEGHLAYRQCMLQKELMQ